MAYQPRLIATVIAGLVGLAVPAPEARAASLSVNPTQIRLSPRAPSALLTLRNEGTAAIRVQVSVHAWAQRLTGEMDLNPTTDIVFFPSMLTLEPGQARTIRIGTTASFTQREQAYRMFVEELPSPNAPGTDASAVRMYTRLGIPIFLEPETVRTEAALSDVRLQGDTLTFRLRNTGTWHFIPDTVVVRGSGPRGEVVLDRNLTGWYVLAGTAREFTVTFDSNECGVVRALAIEARVGHLELKEQLATPRGTCRP